MDSIKKRRISKKLMIIDVDAGIDDVQAIMLALSNAEWEVLAITCVFGNTSLDNVGKNVLRVLKVCKRLDIPVFKGSALSILGSSKYAPHVHGDDGLGGYGSQVQIEDLLHLIKSEHAFIALSRLADEYPEQITLVALGPLTNLALTQKFNPSFQSKLKQLSIMGGNIKASGNVTVCAEFNFYSDPEAAFIVLNEFICPIQLFSWDTTHECQLNWDWCDKWLETKTEKAIFIKECTEKARLRFREVLKQDGYHSCDLVTMAAVICPELIMEEESCYATVELKGKLTRGQAIIDWSNILNMKNRVTIPKKIDLINFQEMCNKLFL